MWCSLLLPHDTKCTHFYGPRTSKNAKNNLQYEPSYDITMRQTSAAASFTSHETVFSVTEIVPRRTRKARRAGIIEMVSYPQSPSARRIGKPSYGSISACRVSYRYPLYRHLNVIPSVTGGSKSASSLLHTRRHGFAPPSGYIRKGRRGRSGVVAIFWVPHHKNF